MVTHDKNQHMVQQVLRGGGPQSTSVTLWLNSILWGNEVTFLGKRASWWSVKSSKTEEDPL